MRSTVYCRSAMGAPWGFGVEAHGNPSFHVVTHGKSWLEVEGESHARRLRGGDLVLLPNGPRHWLRDDPTSPTAWLDDILAATPPDENGRLRYGGDGARTELICGGFVLEGEPNPILSALPTVVHVGSTDGGPVPWVAATLELVSAVADSDVAGAEAVLSRLADTMLTQALRFALSELGSSDPARIAALRDARIAKAVQLIHREPERAWTVDALASSVAYSRSGFAGRFRELRRVADELRHPHTPRDRGEAPENRRHHRRDRSPMRLCERVIVQPSVQARVRACAGRLSGAAGAAAARAHSRVTVIAARTSLRTDGRRRTPVARRSSRFSPSPTLRPRTCRRASSCGGHRW